MIEVCKGQGTMFYIHTNTHTHAWIYFLAVNDVPDKEEKGESAIERGQSNDVQGLTTYELCYSYTF